MSSVFVYVGGGQANKQYFINHIFEVMNNLYNLQSVCVSINCGRSQCGSALQNM